jgi:hypothetical protein
VTSPLAFSVTFDYRCPFARNAHEHVLAGLRAGADWDVTFVPFSLGQVHVAEGEPDIWGRWQDDSGLLALQVAMVVRDRHPERFLEVHEALFALRHDEGGHLKDPQAVQGVLDAAGLDGAAILAEVDGGEPLETVRLAHEAAAKQHKVWGVPTFIRGDRAVFVRLMDRPRHHADSDAGPHAIRSIERVVDLLDGFVELNEFKHTSIPR